MEFVLVLTFPKQFAARLGPIYHNNSNEMSLFMLAKRQGSKQDSLCPSPQFCFTRSFADFLFCNCRFCWLGYNCTRAQEQKILPPPRIKSAELYSKKIRHKSAGKVKVEHLLLLFLRFLAIFTIFFKKY